jgi:predicted outer membrane lipoprotein
LVICSECRLERVGLSQRLSARLAATGNGDAQLRRRVLRLIGGGNNDGELRLGRMGWALGLLLAGGVALALVCAHWLERVSHRSGNSLNGLSAASDKNAPQSNVLTIEPFRFHRSFPDPTAPIKISKVNWTLSGDGLLWGPPPPEILLNVPSVGSPALQRDDGPIVNMMYAVNMDVFMRNLEKLTAPVAATNIAYGSKADDVYNYSWALLTGYLRQFGIDFGMDSSHGNKRWFFNDKAGTILVRAPQRDQEIIRNALNQINRPVAQIQVEAVFYSMDAQAAKKFAATLQNLPAVISDRIRESDPPHVMVHVASGPNGSLTNAVIDDNFTTFSEEQFRLICKEIDGQCVRKNLTTLSGRLCHLEIRDEPQSPPRYWADFTPTALPGNQAVELLAMPGIVARQEDRSGKPVYQTNIMITQLTAASGRVAMLSGLMSSNVQTLVFLAPRILDPIENMIITNVVNKNNTSRIAR